MSSTISNSNYYSVSASSNNGIAGLVSGMDTDSMVKQMLSGTQSKIDAKKQEKQQLEWKQEQYRDVVASINSFSGKYFDTAYDSTLATNLSNTNLFNSMVSSVTSGSSVKLVSTGTSAATGTTTIRVDQLASAARLQSSAKMSGNQTISGSDISVQSIKNRVEGGGEFSIDLTLDGVKKTITLTQEDLMANGTYNSDSVTAETIADALKEKTKNAFGDYVSVKYSGGSVTFGMNIKAEEAPAEGVADERLPENGHELTVTGSDARLIGIEPGASSLVSGATKLGTLGGVTGDIYKFSINGTDFEFSAGTSVSKMMNTINSSNAGVRMTYSSMTDSFALEQTSTGKGYGIDIVQESGNLLSTIFGSDTVAEGKVAESAVLNTPTIEGSLASGYTTEAASMKMNVNGTDYTFKLAATSGTTYDKAAIEEKLNAWLKTNFGETNGTANISYSDGKLNTAQGYAVSFAKSSTGEKSDLAVAFGFSNATGGVNNFRSADTSIADISALEGISFLKEDESEATTLSEIASISYADGAKSAKVSYSNGRLQLSEAGEYDFSGANDTALAKLFGASVKVGDGGMNENAVAAGTDAEVVINGIATTRSSNTFSFDGITVTATAVSAEETVIGTARDTEKIIDTIKSFVNDYNTLIEDLYSRVTQDADYRNYKPLTSEQEDEMTEKQIELWEEKAQKGLLRGDTDINTLIDSMRSAVYTTAGSSGLALFSIGIESESWNGAGKLTIDESLLRTAVESDPEGIAALFTDETSGVAATLSVACDRAAKTSLADTGSLVAKAGAKNWTAGDKINDIYTELQRIDDRLDYLDDLYQSQKSRYWQQFSSMETIMSNYNSQSAMLSNMFA